MKLVKVNKKQVRLGNTNWKQLGVTFKKKRSVSNLNNYGGVF